MRFKILNWFKENDVHLEMIGVGCMAGVFRTAFVIIFIILLLIIFFYGR